jgi:hypothetical protein
MYAVHGQPSKLRQTAESNIVCSSAGAFQTRHAATPAPHVALQHQMWYAASHQSQRTETRELKSFLSIELQDSKTAQEAACQLDRYSWDSGVGVTAEGNVLTVNLKNPLVAEIFSGISALARSIGQLVDYLRSSRDPATSA